MRTPGLFFRLISTAWLSGLLPCVVGAFFMFAPVAFGAAPTAREEAGVVGLWRVKGSDFDRQYEITAGRNLKIVGGAKEKRGRLIPQQDGSFHVALEEDAVLRMVFTPEADRLVIECFKKKNLALGLSPMWKVEGVRLPAPKK